MTSPRTCTSTAPERSALAAANSPQDSTPTNQEKHMYTVQQDAHGNRIVCKGSTVRRGYRVIWTGDYNECLRVKVNGAD